MSPNCVQSRALHESAQEEVKDKMNGNKEDGVMKGVPVLLRLDQAFTLEIHVILKDNKSESAIFINPPAFVSYDK